MILLLTACIYDYFSGYVHYQALEYTVGTPRVVGIRSPGLDMVSEKESMLDALLLAPLGADVGDWTISTCGLGRSVETESDLSCFKEESEVQVLATGALPLTFRVPELPPIEDCYGGGEGSAEDGDGDGEPFWDTGKDRECHHRLPLLFETSVGGEPVYGAVFPDWYDHDPLPESPDGSAWGSAEVPVPLSARPSAFRVPESAGPGEVVELEYELHADLRYTQFHWYVDGGVLLDTGLTAAVEYVPASSEHPSGITRTRNRWQLPGEAAGGQRVWVVAQSWGSPLDMVWRSATVEVR